MAITRDDVLHDRIRQRLQRENAAGASHALLDETRFEQSRQQILAEMAAHGELWVFGYGSLIWNPTFEFVQSEIAELPGLARRFCLWAHTGRGSPQVPGLWLGLDDEPGAGDEPGLDDGLPTDASANPPNCIGFAFRVADAVRDHETLMLWRREMVSGAYTPTVRPITFTSGKLAGQARACICLEANKAHPRYAGRLTRAQVVEAITRGEGHLGTCREYLFNVVDKLASVGVRDAELDELVREVRNWPTPQQLQAGAAPARPVPRPR